jgi:hypothetical protein
MYHGWDLPEGVEVRLRSPHVMHAVAGASESSLWLTSPQQPSKGHEKYGCN